MKIAGKNNNRFVISIERGEELFTSLKAFLISEKIVAGSFSGLGAADHLEVAYYNLKTREYERQTIREEVEILSLQGNVAWKGEELILHIHGVFGRRDLSTFGGHLFSIVVSGVCEMHFVTLPKKMGRTFDAVTGLNTLCAIPDDSRQTEKPRV
jgi:predicted DNA-binding protein with PD1-like motif